MNTDELLDLIYNFVHDHCVAGRFSVVDKLIQHADPWKMDTDAILGFLVATIPAKKHLHYRARFYANSGIDEDLLVGLE